MRFFIILLLSSFSAFGLESNATAIVRLKLNSNADGNGYSFTNVGIIRDTNGNVLGGVSVQAGSNVLAVTNGSLITVNGKTDTNNIEVMILAATNDVQARVSVPARRYLQAVPVSLAQTPKFTSIGYKTSGDGTNWQTLYMDLKSRFDFTNQAIFAPAVARWKGKYIMVTDSYAYVTTNSFGPVLSSTNLLDWQYVANVPLPVVKATDGEPDTNGPPTQMTGTAFGGAFFTNAADGNLYFYVSAFSDNIDNTTPDQNGTLYGNAYVTWPLNDAASLWAPPVPVVPDNTEMAVIKRGGTYFMFIAGSSGIVQSYTNTVSPTNRFYLFQSSAAALTPAQFVEAPTVCQLETNLYALYANVSPASIVAISTNLVNWSAFRFITENGGTPGKGHVLELTSAEQNYMESLAVKKQASDKMFEEVFYLDTTTSLTNAFEDLRTTGGSTVARITYDILAVGYAGSGGYFSAGAALTVVALEATQQGSQNILIHPLDQPRVTWQQKPLSGGWGATVQYTNAVAGDTISGWSSARLVVWSPATFQVKWKVRRKIEAINTEFANSHYVDLHTTAGTQPGVIGPDTGGNFSPVQSGSVMTTTTNYTTGYTNDIIRVDTSSGNRTITLISVPVPGQSVTVKKITTDSNTLTVNGGGHNIDGASTISSSIANASFVLNYDTDTGTWNATAWQMPQLTDASGLTNANATTLFGSGTVPTARLGSGTANANTVLLGTQAYGSVPNAGLANSAITINGTSVSLGGTRTLTLASSDFANQGTTTTVLHGNASGNPSFAPVVENDLSLSAVATANVSITKHGFAPVLPNDATKYLDGTGAYTVPAGSGGTGIATNNGTGTNNVFTGATEYDRTSYRYFITAQWGTNNTINRETNAILSGMDNTINNNSTWGTIAGGQGNVMAGTVSSPNVISGGRSNNVTGVAYAVIGGGLFNVVGKDYTFLGGGFNNTNSGNYSTLPGGILNNISNNADYSVIAGGYSNVIGGANGILSATIAGGTNNQAGASRTLAAGTRAKAVHAGAFVLSDSQEADASSTTTDQLFLRFQNGQTNTGPVGMGNTLAVAGNSIFTAGLTNTSAAGITYNALQSPTNSSFAPDFNLGNTETNIGAAFTLSLPIHVNTALTMGQTTLLIIRTNGTAGSPFALTTPTGVKGTGTAFVTNTTIVTVFAYGNEFTNYNYTPIY